MSGHEVALGGGVAIQVRLAASGLGGRRDRIADVDFVARGREAVAASLTKDFLVCHYHTPQAGYPKFLVMVVDPVSRLRVDIFPDLVGAIERAQPMTVCDQTWLVLDAESMLDHKLLMLAQASEGSPVDEKHPRDVATLAALAGRWVPPMLATAVAKDTYSTDLDAHCPRCEASRDAAFPLAPKQQILDLLGYV